MAEFRYTTYHSAIHAASVVVQLYKGVSAGLELSANLYDLVPTDDDCDALLLARIIADEGLSCDAQFLDPAEVGLYVATGLSKRCVTLFKCNAVQGLPGQRWAVVQGLRNHLVDYGICIGPHEQHIGFPSIEELAHGDCVQMRYMAWPGHRIAARIIWADPESEAAYTDSLLTRN
jgi:hypothetical protein